MICEKRCFIVMKSCPLVLDSLGTVEFSIKFLTLIITKQLSKNSYQSYSMQHLGIQLLHSALVCLNIYMSFIFLLSLFQLAIQLIFYSQFLAIRLFKIRYSTVSLIKELHLHSFKLYQKVLYFNKQRFCGKKPQVRYVVIF